MNSDFEKIKKLLSLLRHILLTLCTLVAVAGFLVLARSVVNAIFLHSYNTGHYYSIPENLLPYLPFGENYVAPYNLGNVEYQKGNYDKAVYYYTLAYQNEPPEHPARDEECRIRVNLALSLCHTIDFDHLDTNDSDAVAEAVSTLQQARAILTEDGCASVPVGSNDGHYPGGARRKHDIDRMLEKLQSQSDSSQDENGNGGGGGDDQNEDNNGGQDEQNQDQNDSNSNSQKTDSEREKEERARQEQLKQDLEQQKEDLKDGSSSSSYDYEYIDGGDAQGYGEGTLW